MLIKKNEGLYLVWKTIRHFVSWGLVYEFMLVVAKPVKDEDTMDLDRPFLD